MPFISPQGFYTNDASSEEPWDSTEITHFNEIERSIVIGTIDGKKRSDSSGAYMPFIAHRASVAGFNGNEDVNVIPSVYADPSGSIFVKAYSSDASVTVTAIDSNEASHSLIISGDSNNKVIVNAQSGGAADGLEIDSTAFTVNAANSLSLNATNGMSVSAPYVNMSLDGNPLVLSGATDNVYISTEASTPLNIITDSLVINVVDTNDGTHEIVISGDSNNKVHVVSNTGSDTLSLEGASVAMLASSGSCSINSPSTIALTANSQSLTVSGAPNTVSLTAAEYDSINLIPNDLAGVNHALQVSGDSAGQLKISAISGSDTLWLNGFSVDCSASGGSVGIQGPGGITLTTNTNLVANSAGFVFTGPTFTLNSNAVLTDSTIVNWLASASVTGLTSTSGCALFYKKIGSSVDVYYYLTGTGSGSAFHFTLPYPMNSLAPAGSYNTTVQAQDDNTSVVGNAGIAAGGSTCSLYSTGGNGTWVSKATTRQAFGYIRYPI